MLLRIGLVTLAATATLLLAGPSLAEDQAAAPAPDSHEIVCKTSTTATGTRLGAHKTCMTRIEWQQQEQADREAVSQAQSSSLRARPPGS
jgi:hypothetical protein